MLSQLSYSPILALSIWLLAFGQKLKAQCQWPLLLVGLGRVELPTSPLSGVRSSHLSYRPMELSLVELVGIEPATS